MEFVNQGTGRPQPKVGYRCKVCGKEGGLVDSHWYQLCPFKGKEVDKRSFNLPREGYVCKFCHKKGGSPDSHWFQQCPKKNDFEGVQVPHPLKTTTPQMFNMVPQAHTVASQTAMTMNVGMFPQSSQIDYSQQISANGLGVYMYPNNQQIGQPQLQQQVTQQHLFIIQQQLAQQQQTLMQQRFNSQTTQQQLPIHQSHPQLQHQHQSLYRNLPVKFGQETSLQQDEKLLSEASNQQFKKENSAN